MKLNEKQMFKIFKRMFDYIELSNITKDIIFQDKYGSYIMYNRYSIKSLNGSFITSKNHTFTVKTFNNLKNAVVWTTLDHTEKVVAANRVLELDTLLASTLEHIKLYEKSFKNAKNLETLSIADTKLQEEILRKDRIIRELDDYANLTQRWQNKKFNDITAK